MAKGGIKGNKGGAKGRSGRKSKAEELGLKALLDECVTEQDRKDLFISLLVAGKKGDTKASSLLLAYIYGKPKETHELTGKDGGDLFTQLTVRVVDGKSSRNK